jgi:putative transposase
MGKVIDQWKLPNKRSLRLPGHNYAGTASYFLTMRSEHHEPVFDMSELRTIVENEWEALPARFPHVRLDSYIVMPDHMHNILHFTGGGSKTPALGQVIGAYKSLTTDAWIKYVKTHNVSWSGLLWQFNFHDHIILDYNDLEQKREYIRKNPIRWQQQPDRYS